MEIVALKWSVIQIAWFSCPRTHHFSYANVNMLGILGLYSMPMGQETQYELKIIGMAHRVRINY